MEMLRITRRLLGPAGPPLRDAVATVGARMGYTDPSRRAAGQLTIVTFHRVLDESKRKLYPLPGLVVTPDELTWFLTYFTARYECGSLTEMIDLWRGSSIGDKPLLAITFDDAQLDNYENARPILNRFKIRASFYVPVAHVTESAPLWHDRLGFAAKKILGRANGREILEACFNDRPSLKNAGIAPIIESAKILTVEERENRIKSIEKIVGSDNTPGWAGVMNWSHLETLRDEGHEIGSHSMTHPLLPQSDQKELEFEIVESRRTIEDRLGVPPDTFCYPNGDCDVRAVSTVERAGYKAAVTTDPGTNRLDESMFRLRRFDMNARYARSRNGEYSRARLALHLATF